MSKYIESPIFYMGNKYKLLKSLIALFPKQCSDFIDAFGGSGVVSCNYQGSKYTTYVDNNPNTAKLIKLVKYSDPDELHKYLVETQHEFKLDKKLDYKERVVQYNLLRNRYNEHRDVRDLYLLSCCSINHLIRYNSNGDFNAPCGYGKYKASDYRKLGNFNYAFRDVLVIYSSVFDINWTIGIPKDAFFYFDPPYSSSTAVYNESRAFGHWTEKDDKKLFNLCDELSNQGIKWGMSNVFEIKKKTNSKLEKWAKQNHYNVYHLNRNYSAFGSGSSESDEVYICNYDALGMNIKGLNLENKQTKKYENKRKSLVE